MSVCIVVGRALAEASIAALAAGSPATPNSSAITVANTPRPIFRASTDVAKELYPFSCATKRSYSLSETAF